MRLRVMAMALCALGVQAGAEQATCPVAADTWLEFPESGRPKRGQTAQESHGAEAQLVIRGRAAFALLRFDLTAAKGMTVSRATLRVHRAADPTPLHTVGLSTVSGSGEWSEGAASFLIAREGRGAWSYPGSDVSDVTFGQGGSLYSYARVRDAGEGWHEADVPPAMVHALLAGDQYGLMLTDEKGQTQTRHVLSSREGSHPPVLVVEGTRSDRAAPGRARAASAGDGVIASTPAQARALGRSTFAPGSVIVRFGGAGDDGGRGVAAKYELRYSERPLAAGGFEAAGAVPRWSLDPLAPQPGRLATANSARDEVVAVVEGLEPGRTYYFAARATDEAGNAGPVSPLGRYRAWTRAFPELPAEPPARNAPTTAAGRPQVWAVPELWKIDPRTGKALEAGGADERSGNRVWNAGTSTVRLEGARNEFVAFQLAVEGKDLAEVSVTVERPLFAGSRLPAVFRQSGAVELYREWFVPDDKQTAEPRGWYADALVPLTAPFSIPARDNGVPGQTVQPVFVDIYIPRDAAAGVHKGQLLVKAGALRREIAIEVEVHPFALPDKLSFVVDLNCYGGVNAGWDVERGTPEYRALEVAYHRMAHMHRCNLDVLGYQQTGAVDPDHAPPLSGQGAGTRVSDWSGWDARFGPILDGSAFGDLPRAGIPVPAIYIPFFENWPGEMRSGYRFNEYPPARTEEEYQQIVTHHALNAAPIEESFTAEYRERFSAVAAEFAAHLEQRKWTDTRYYVYLNNKYYRKRPPGGVGSSWWLLDEPNHRDDVRAISFFATLLERGLEKHPHTPIRLRTDISRVEWIRDLLAGQIDLNCISQRFFDKNRYLVNDRRRFGQELWHYATTNHPRDTNIAMRAWAWSVWLNGGDGLLPWNAVSARNAWEQAAQLTVFYPGGRFGKREPFASLRLKAFRRGQQDVEYLALLSKKGKWGRDAVTRSVSGSLDLASGFQQAYEEDAGTVDFRKVEDRQLEALRRRVARAIVAAPGGAPPARGAE